MKFKSFGPINSNKTDKKSTAVKAAPKYIPSILPKVK